MAEQAQKESPGGASTFTMDSASVRYNARHLRLQGSREFGFRPLRYDHLLCIPSSNDSADIRRKPGSDRPYVKPTLPESCVSSGLEAETLDKEELFIVQLNLRQETLYKRRRPKCKLPFSYRNNILK
ncbi:uncharacterized protein LOC117103872 [Anneissia japonica]|uniref:uncharacterized protein LOC117103872 n=1 Tax=Anneissia japonica TaxID=1529436 RepID=UPI0014255D14|nr:uncharacterized protein LOC117103872 [Anneissia japonica]